MINPRFWFVPCFSGDFRLEREGEDKCVLTVEDPTKADQRKLGTFLMAARADGWLNASAGIAQTGTTRLVLDVPLRIAGPLLAKKAHGDANTWTAVRYLQGKVEVYDGVDLPAQRGQGVVEVVKVGANIFAKALASLTPNDTAEAVATVKEPSRGCPAPAPARRRGAQVLAIFSTAAQLDSLTRHGRMKVVGNATGDAYWLYHRDEAAKQQLAHCLVNARTGYDVCVWDDSVPPEEEMLAVKLAVEHREAWTVGLAKRVLRST